MTLIELFYVCKRKILLFRGFLLSVVDPPTDYSTDYCPNCNPKISARSICHVLAIFCKFRYATPYEKDKVLQRTITTILVYAFVAFQRYVCLSACCSSSHFSDERSNYKLTVASMSRAKIRFTLPSGTISRVNFDIATYRILLRLATPNYVYPRYILLSLATTLLVAA
jgi:hypothetical protein